jgi:curved DNA-binding protein CbpA
MTRLRPSRSATPAPFVDPTRIGRLMWVEPESGGPGGCLAGDRYKGFLFVPSDLAEDVDLSLEEKKEILFLHARLATLSFWELLGVPWNASADEATAAYRQLAMRLHPDRHRGKRLGKYAARLQAVFPRLNEARETLADPARREAYARKTAGPEERAKLQLKALEEERRSAEKRARLARQNPLVANAARVSEILARARQRMEEGRWAQAANDFQTAVAMDPRNDEARRLGEEARRKAGTVRATEWYERGLAAELAGQPAAALPLFAKAIEEDPAEPRYVVASSRAARATGDLAAAREAAERAVRIGPKHAAAHEEMAQVLVAQGETREARRLAERALELDPSLEGARSLLRKRWGIF